MGYRPEPTIYNLTFEGTPYDGLHVKMSCCTLAEHNEMMRAQYEAIMRQSDFEGAIKDQNEQEVAKMKEQISGQMRDNNRTLELFANHLVSWDIENLAGEQVPANRDGMDSQERALISHLVAAWQAAMVSVPKISSSNSSSGGTSEEQSLDLGSISENLGS